MSGIKFKGISGYDFLLKKYAAGLITVSVSRNHPELVAALENILDVKSVVTIGIGQTSWNATAVRGIKDTGGYAYVVRVEDEGEAIVSYTDENGDAASTVVKTGNAFVCVSGGQTWAEAKWLFVSDDEVVVTVDNKAATFGWGQTVTVATVQGKNITIAAPADPAVGDVAQVTYDSNNVLQPISGSTKKYLKLPEVYAKYDPNEGNARGLYVRYWDATGTEHSRTVATVENLQQIFGISDIEDAIEALQALIPSQASQNNQLADKGFVNSSVSTATATYRGSYNLVKQISEGGLGLHVGADPADIALALATVTASLNPDNNDYAFVEIPVNDSTPDRIEQVDRWKFNGTVWAFEYHLNNSGFTDAQWKTINSGIVATDKSKLNTYPADGATAFAAKVDKVTGKGLSTNDFTTPEKTKLASAIVGATSGTNPVVGTVKVMTSAEYYALTTVDANTEYIII